MILKMDKPFFVNKFIAKYKRKNYETINYFLSSEYC